MAVVLIKDQVKVAYHDINVAQIEAALITYAADSTIVDGLTALKDEIIGAMALPCDCPQCGNYGRVDADLVAAATGVNICPLCTGQTKTDGQYTVKQLLQGYNTP